MSIASKTITGSPDLTVLAFSVVFDISQGIPAITITNASTITSGRANYLTWWFVLSTPSGTPIHVGSLSSPDVYHAAWTTYSIPPGSWPTPGGTAPFAQVEFAPGAPYVCTVYVQDSTPTTFNLGVATIITRPTGNNSNTRGNFGVASVLVETNCQYAQILGTDNTNYAYQNLLGTSSSSVWTLTYPPNANGQRVSNATAINTPNVIFPVGFSGPGYTISYYTFATYDFGNGGSVIIQYKYFDDFAVWCSIDLCPIQCGITNLQKLVANTKGQVENSNYLNRLTEITSLMANNVLPGIAQPTCGIDVPAIIAKIQYLLSGIDCNCGCGQQGVNYTNPTPAQTLITVSVTVPIYVKTPNGPLTTIGPSQLNYPGQDYFPTQVYDPTGLIKIGVAMTYDQLITILKENAAWAAYGQPFAQDIGSVGWFPASPGTVIPSVYISDGLGTGAFGTEQYFEPGPFAGSTVYLVRLLSVQNFFTTSPQILVSPSDFPANFWLVLQSGVVWLGSQPNLNTLITALNTAATGLVTFYAAINDLGTINITFEPIPYSTYSWGDRLFIYTDAKVNNYLFYGANNKGITPSPPSVGAITGLGLAIGGFVGSIQGYDDTKTPWQVKQVNNRIVSVQGDTGKVYVWNISNPLLPQLEQILTLEPNGSSPTPAFSGTPHVSSIPWYYSCYSCTDYDTAESNQTTFCEGLSGTVWATNIPSGASSFNLAGTYNVKFLGKCQRINVNGTIFYTQDGTLESDAGLSSTVPTGYIITTPATSNTITELNLLASNGEQVWAAAYDGISTIYFVGQYGSVVLYNPFTATILGTYLEAFATGTAGGLVPLGTYGSRMNLKYYQGYLYLSMFGFDNPAGSPGYNSGTIYCEVNTLSTTPQVKGFASFTAGSNPIVDNFNVIPVGNLFYVTAQRNGIGYIAIFTLQGQYLGNIPMTSGSMYNLVTLPAQLMKGNQPTYSPTSLM